MDNLPQLVLEAEQRIKRYIRETPLQYSRDLSSEIGGRTYLKLESEQLTCSFKIRGAFNKLLANKDKLENNGFKTASTGNHGKAVAYVAQGLGLTGTVYVSDRISKAKLEALQGYFGVSIQKLLGNSGEVEVQARKIAEKAGIHYISPYNDLEIIAGQGTVGVEIYRQSWDIDTVITCIGGGGLISGMGSYLKSQDRDIRIIGCEPENSCQMSRSIAAGKVVEVEHKPTLSEGSAGGFEPDSITFELCQRYVDDYITVSEDEIKKAMYFMIHKHHRVVEGAAAVPLAALMKTKHKFKNKNVVVVLSGSNVGIDVIREVVG